mmetsp:Transcript_9490/g.27750  ORF Transcript_9490/g.27750 Transcript_9490/m.27750 type:complete len:288 (-) Transcript_9490:729-1592(-)
MKLGGALCYRRNTARCCREALLRAALCCRAPHRIRRGRKRGVASLEDELVLAQRAAHAHGLGRRGRRQCEAQRLLAVNADCGLLGLRRHGNCDRHAGKALGCSGGLGRIPRGCTWLAYGRRRGAQRDAGGRPPRRDAGHSEVAPAEAGVALHLRLGRERRCHARDLQPGLVTTRGAHHLAQQLHRCRWRGGLGRENGRGGDLHVLSRGECRETGEPRRARYACGVRYPRHGLITADWWVEGPWRGCGSMGIERSIPMSALWWGRCRGTRLFPGCLGDSVRLRRRQWD